MTKASIVPVVLLLAAGLCSCVAGVVLMQMWHNDMTSSRSSWPLGIRVPTTLKFVNPEVAYSAKLFNDMKQSSNCGEYAAYMNKTYPPLLQDLDRAYTALKARYARSKPSATQAKADLARILSPMEAMWDTAAAILERCPRGSTLSYTVPGGRTTTLDTATYAATLKKDSFDDLIDYLWESLT
jgi:hypothetical protein